MPRPILHCPPPPKPHKLISKQPNPSKQQPNHNKKPQPNPPAHARPIRHPHHPLHCALQPRPRPLKLLIQLTRQITAIPNLLANRHGELFELPYFLRQQCCGGVFVLGLEFFEDRGGVLAFAVGGGGAVG